MSMIFSTRPWPMGHPMRAAAVVRPTPPLTIRKDVGRATQGRFCTFSTGAPDRMNDTVNPLGWHLDAFKRNPILLYAHDYQSEPIGKVLGIRADARGLTGTLEPPPRGVSPLADRIFDLWDSGFLNATSVGFRPLRQEVNTQRGGIDFHEQELLEVSVVPVPANCEALGQGRGVSDPEAVRRWISGGAVAKPFSGQHACLFTPRSRYQQFRTDEREHEGKPYLVVYGKAQDGAWEQHSFHYGASEWSASEARAHCRAHGGTFEPATGGKAAGCGCVPADAVLELADDDGLLLELAEGR